VSNSKSSKLFGEVSAGTVLPPPVPQESPRSPSPVRKTLTVEVLRPEASRSAGALTRPQSASALDRRRTELTTSAQPIKPTDSREEEGNKRANAAEKAKVDARAEATQRLDYDDESRLRKELQSPPSPAEKLLPFLPNQPIDVNESKKSGIPAQIERLFRDINSMTDTLGINSRSLSEYILYQTQHGPTEGWPQLLNSKTPRDVLVAKPVLQQITGLVQGRNVLGDLLDGNRIDDVDEKSRQCQDLLNRDMVQLRVKLGATRRALLEILDVEARLSAPLSAEQASLQHDLRKASVSVQTKLVEAEKHLAFLRAKLTEAKPPRENGSKRTGNSMVGQSSAQKKPTVEAVTSTISKLTSMAVKKSTDVDVLEAQLRRLGLGPGDSNSGSRNGSVEPHGTPQRGNNSVLKMQMTRTPGSTNESVYHTPDSRFSGGRSTPRTFQRSFRANVDASMDLISTEDSERWREKARRRKAVHDLLREALAERRNASRPEGEQQKMGH
jgi:nucleoporin NUP159